MTVSHMTMQNKIHTAFRLIQNCLSNQKQRTKINTEYSLRGEILFEVPKSSIFESLLLSIFLCDLFLIMNNIELSSYDG